MSFLNGLPVQGHNRSLPSRPMGLWKGSVFLLSRGRFWTQVFLALNCPSSPFKDIQKCTGVWVSFCPWAWALGEFPHQYKQLYIFIVFRRRMFLALCTRIHNLFNIFMETYLKISCGESMNLNCCPLHFFLSWFYLILKVLVGRPKKEKKSLQRGGGASFILVRCVLFSSIKCHLQSPGKNQIVPQDFLFAAEWSLRHSRLPSLGLWEARRLTERPRESQPRRHFWRVWGPQVSGSSPCSPWQVAPSCFQTAAAATQLHLTWMDDELLNVCATVD